jgi:hypothetical protein
MHLFQIRSWVVVQILNVVYITVMDTSFCSLKSNRGRSLFDMPVLW